MRGVLNFLKHTAGWRLVVAASVSVLAGCSALPTLPDWQAPQGTPDFRQSKVTTPNQVIVTPIPGILQGTCEAEVELHAPPTSRTRAVVVFAHGFLHSIDQHRELAQHFAAWGVPTYLVGLCPAGWSRGGAPLLAALMRTVAERSGKSQIIYGGFSAGGSAAYLAARDDPKTAGLLGLDPVGHGMASAVRRASFPALGLFGPANRCNAGQSGRSLFNPANGDVLREIANTTHCHFEGPTDWLCRVACGEPGNVDQLREVRGRIYGLATAYVRWRAGLDETSPEAWWQPVEGVLREVEQLVGPPAGPAFTR